MNHNFKLKSGGTSVTNDAGLLNYALKSARDVRRQGRRTRDGNPGQPDKESHFSSRPLLRRPPLPVRRRGRCWTTRGPPNLSDLLPIFNACGACRERGEGGERRASMNYRKSIRLLQPRTIGRPSITRSDFRLLDRRSLCRHFEKFLIYIRSLL